jgi:hypothetical protein
MRVRNTHGMSNSIRGVNAKALGGSMPKRKTLPTVLFLLPATILLTSHSSVAESADGECRAKPGDAAPSGMHWYYRVDRENNRHCWYLHALGLSVHSRASETSADQGDENAGEDASPASLRPANVPSSIRPSGDAQKALPETALPESSAADRPVIDFAARWLDLPTSIDLDRRGPAAAGSAYAPEQGTTNAQRELPPALASVSTVDNEAQPNSTHQSHFGSLSLAGAAVLALLLISEALVRAARSFLRKARPRLRRRLNIGASRRAGRLTAKPREARKPEPGANELGHILRRADAGVQPARSFAPSGSKTGDRATSARRHVRAHSSFQRLKTGSFGPRWAPL